MLHHNFSEIPTPLGLWFNGLFTFGASDISFYIKRIYKMIKYFFINYFYKPIDIIRFNTSTTGY